MKSLSPVKLSALHLNIVTNMAPPPPRRNPARASKYLRVAVSSQGEAMQVSSSSSNGTRARRNSSPDPRNRVVSSAYPRKAMGSTNSRRLQQHPHMWALRRLFRVIEAKRNPRESPSIRGRTLELLQMVMALSCLRLQLPFGLAFGT